MYRVSVLFTFVLAVSQASEPPASPPLRCGVTPSAIFRCLGNPKIVKPEVAAQCTKSLSECERLRCIFKNSGWLSGKEVDLQKVEVHFDEFAQEHPAWSAAVQQVRATCLVAGLPAQGVYVNCAPYDVTHCALTSFFKNAPASQWLTSPDCEYPRQFAASCPVCPEDCFAPAIPYGSCNACRLLPQTP